MTHTSAVISRRARSVLGQRLTRFFAVKVCDVTLKPWLWAERKGRNMACPKPRAPLIYALTLLAACSDPPDPGTETQVRPHSPALVSASIAQPAASNTAVVGGYAYVSMVPGTETDAWYAEVRNLRGGTSATSPMWNGGFDPIAVEAEVGDTLSITVFHQTGGETTTYGVVPIRSHPTVVRTSPASGKTDVPLNSVILVVFNQPMDSASVAVALHLQHEGVDVPGSVSADPTGGVILTGQFVPDSPLAPLSTYEISVSTAAQSPDGITLGAPFTVEFATGSSAASTQFSALKLVPEEMHLPTAAPGNAARLFVRALDASGRDIPLSAAASFSSSAPEIATVSSEGVVTSVAPGTAVITATLTQSTVTRTASASVTTHSADSRTGQYPNVIGIWDLTGVITSSDPAWGIPDGTRQTAVLIVQSAQPTQSTPPVSTQFRGTFTDFRALEPGEPYPDEATYAFPGTVIGSIDASGHVVIELFFNGFEESQSSYFYGEGMLASGLIQGTYGAGGHISGTFTVVPRPAD